MDSRHHQQQCSRVARQHREQLEEAGEKLELSYDRDLVKSTTASSCSGTCDVTERDDDVISSLRHSSSPPAARSVYIHRPFEDVPAPVQLNDPRRLGAADRGGDHGLATVTEEPRHGWLAHGSLDGGSASWRRRHLQALVDDDVLSAGDSACCDDDDVSDRQVRAVDRHDDDDMTSPRHYQPQHCRQPAGSSYSMYTTL